MYLSPNNKFTPNSQFIHKQIQYILHVHRLTIHKVGQIKKIYNVLLINKID